nr:MAG TPA: hypothetical protein [Caudoviricetes sp.]
MRHQTKKRKTDKVEASISKTASALSLPGTAWCTHLQHVIYAALSISMYKLPS